MRFISWKPSNYTIALIAVLALIAATAPSIHAQNNYGTVRGRVTDDSGALIPDAQVILTNDGTEIARITRSSQTGDFYFTAVEPGTYTIVVTANNFKRTEHNGIIVNLEQTVTIDEKLTVGAAGETVVVTGTEPLIDTATASGGVVISEDLVEDLPNIGRNPFTVNKLENNVTPTADPKMVRLEDQNGTDSQSIAGAPIGANVFVVDGVPISTSTGGVSFIPALEAVGAVKVQANTYDAELGRTGGGAINTSLKSGTNTYHGVLYGATRQTGLAANQWINNHNGIAKPDYSQYQYAGAIGGKVPFTERYRYTKNTFLWATEEGYRQAQPVVSSNTNFYVPTAAERTGDFSADTGFTIYDPTQPFTGGKRTAQVNAPVNGVLTNNVIPSSLINPIGQYIVNLYPQPNQNTGNLYNYDGAKPNYFGADDFKTRGDEYVGKLDHEFAPWWLASASYAHSATQEPGGNVLHSIASAGGVLTRFIDATAVHNTLTLNPTTVLTVAYGYSRYYSTTPQYLSGIHGVTAFDQATGFGGAGFPSAYVDQLQSNTFPYITLSSLAVGAPSLGGANSGPTIQAQHNFVAVITKTIGKQNLKAGYGFRDFHKFTAKTGSTTFPTNGSFTFNGQYTDATGSASTNGPESIADLLLGLPSSASVTINAPKIDQFLHYQAFFVQDDIRLTSKLSVTAGVRYEYEPGQQESDNRYNVGFDPNISYTFPGANGDVAAKGAIVFAGVNGYPKQSGSLSQEKFNPRVGVSFQVRPDTVVHGGFGVFYAGIPLSSASTGFSQTTSYAPGNATSALASNQTGANAWLSNPFGSTLLQPSGTSLGNLTGVGQSITVPAFHLYYPLVQQYSVDVEKQLPDNFVVKLGYVGAHARNIQLPVNINQLPDNVLASYAPGGTNAGINLSTGPGGKKVTNPYYAATVGGYPATGIISQKTVPLAQTLLPFPQFGSITQNESVGHSQYNALDVKVQKRLSNGLTALVAYTWSSNWDNLYGAQVSGLNQTNPNPSAPQDNYNPDGEYSRATNDTPNRLTFAVTYELPVGHGKKFLGNSNRIVDAVVGGWKINDVTTLQNGGPQPVIQTDLSSGKFGTTGVGGSSQRPNLVAGVDPCYSGSPQSRLGGGGGAKPYFNLNAFTPALPYTYGNAPRTLACKGPGYSNSDLALNKNFKFKRGFNFEFRAEALNAFNKPEFSQAGNTLTFSSTSLTSATFTDPTTNATTGAITSQLGFSRIIQVGGRLSF